MKEIASQLGISQPTVSEILSGRGNRYRKATRERVRKHAIKIGYRPNLLARGLVKGKTHTIGFLTGSPERDFVGAMEVKLDEFAEQAGYEMYTAHTKADLDLTVKRANKLIARGVDGLIVRGMFPAIPVDELQAKLTFPVPTVLLSIGSPKPFACRQVYQDSSVGVSQAVDHLYKLGHRQIYMFRMDWVGWEKDLRFTGFREAVKKYDLGNPEEKLFRIAERGRLDENGHCIVDMEDFAKHLKQFLRDHSDCTAILCSGEDTALPTLATLSRMGIPVPQDISVVGFENSPAMSYTQPPLSTVARLTGKTMRVVFELLLDSIENNNNEPQKVVIPTEFIPRQSTGPVRKDRRA